MAPVKSKESPVSITNLEDLAKILQSGQTLKVGGTTYKIEFDPLGSKHSEGSFSLSRNKHASSGSGSSSKTFSDMVHEESKKRSKDMK